jgi:CheY-like chemotaxis protein
VVLLDLMMPDLDGFQVCQHTRQDARHASTIFIAITGSQAAATEAEQSGLFHRVFLKPVKMALVKEAIDCLLAEQGIGQEQMKNEE